MSRRLAWVTCVLCLLAAGCIEDQPAAPTCDRWSVGDGTYCTPGGARGIHETGFRCVDWPPEFACPADLPSCNDSAHGAFCAAEPLPPEEADRIGEAIAAARGDGTADAEPAPDAGFDALPVDLDAGPEDVVTDAMAGPSAQATYIDAYDPAFIPRSPGIYLRLSWRAQPEGDEEGEGEIGADFDLRLRHPNAGDEWTGPWVCSYESTQPAWSDPADPAFDPWLINDEDYAGAEELHFVAPATGLRYGIAVDALSLQVSGGGPPPRPVSARLDAFVDNAVVGGWRLRFTGAQQRIWIGDIEGCNPRDRSCASIHGEPQVVPWE